MDYEEVLISKVVLENKMTDAVNEGVSSDLFELCKREWNYLVGFFKKHGEGPPNDKFRAMFPKFVFQPIDPPFSFLIEELRDRQTYNIGVQAMRDAAKHFKDKNPTEGIEVFRKAVLEYDAKTRPSRDVNFTDNSLVRLSEYDEVARMGGITGLTSPWPSLDEVTLGFQPEELWMIVARSSVGKSWCEIVGARHHWANGIPTLLFSKEMAVEQFIRRLDAVHAGVAHRRLRSGQLTKEEYHRYTEMLRSLEGTMPFWVSGDADMGGGVSGVWAKINKYKPKSVWIDGLYVMEDERKGRSEPERLKNISLDLKQCARQEGVTIFITHQFNLAGVGDQGTADTLSYGDLKKWFDGILGMYQTDDLRLNREMLFRLLKNREGDLFEWVSDWDLEKMTFSEKSQSIDDIGVEEDEAEGIPF
jgi:hypothetical protein